MQEHTQTPVIQHERVKGFGIALAILAVLSVSGVLLSNAVGMYGGDLVMAVGSMFTIAVILGLVIEKYRKYAQGAVIAWVLYTIAAIISSIYFT